MGRMLVTAVIVSALVGAIAGFVAGYVANPAPAGPTPTTREYWVYTVVLGFNDTLVNQPHDGFYPDSLTANKGDTVRIHFFNTEDEAERHTFTIGAPYNINQDINWQTNVTFEFTASTAGMFTYLCSFHQPTMRGTLVVLG